MGYVFGSGAGKATSPHFVPVEWAGVRRNQVGAGGVFAGDCSEWSVKSRSQFERRRRTAIEVLRFAQDDTRKKRRSSGRPDAQKRGRPAHDTKITEWCRRGRGRAGRAVALENPSSWRCKTDAVLAELPAEIDILFIDDGGKIEQATFEVLDKASGFENAVERGLERFGKLLMLHADGASFS